MDALNKTKLFAFKLAEKKNEEAKTSVQWKVRDGVSVAGCTLVGPEWMGDYRESFVMGDPYPRGADRGYYC